MLDLCNGILAQNLEHLNIILLIGIAILGGTIGARIFHRLNIPSIVGYVAIGIILGPWLGIIPRQMVDNLEPFNMLALGIIGILIGGELKREIFAKFGRQVLTILLFEGLTAFILVAALSFTVTWYFSDWKTGVAVGAVFGAICAATDPASTMSVLWEYKSRGPLTAMLTAIVALDDALALILYAVCVSVAGVVIGHQEVGFLAALFSSFHEIFGSLAVGVLAGFLLNWVLKRTDEPEKALILCISSALLIIGVAITRQLDIILSSMALGVTLTNIGSKKVLSSFGLVHRFAAPIYVLFFVLVGARLRIVNGGAQILFLTVAYIVGTAAGKTIGAWWGAVHSKAVPSIRKYLGFCLYQQGTIAIALLLVASSRFEGQIRNTMLSVIIVGVFVFQLIGPVFVRIGSKKAGEAGLNITEEDLIKTYDVGNMMNRKIPIIAADTTLTEIIRTFGNTESFYYPVLDKNQQLIGAVTVDGIRNTLNTMEAQGWLIALDILEPVTARTTPKVPLADALEQAKSQDLEYLPVVAAQSDNTFLGVLDARGVHRMLSAEVMARQHKADVMQSGTEA